MAFFDLYGPGTQRVIGTDDRDIVTGSLISSDSMVASMMGGNDEVNVYAGFNNFVNGNIGNDIIWVEYGTDFGSYDGFGGYFLGGSENDQLYAARGTVTRMNGNFGNDIVKGFRGANGEFRGGADDDILIVHNGIVFGDKGFDTFLMEIPSEYIGSTLYEYAWVMDYTPGVDQVAYASDYGIPQTTVSEYGLWLSQQDRRQCCSLVFPQQAKLLLLLFRIFCSANVARNT